MADIDNEQQEEQDAQPKPHETLAEKQARELRRIRDLQEDGREAAEQQGHLGPDGLDNRTNTLPPPAPEEGGPGGWVSPRSMGGDGR